MRLCPLNLWLSGSFTSFLVGFLLLSSPLAAQNRDRASLTSPDLNFDSWAKEFEATSASEPPPLPEHKDMLAELDAPEFRKIQGVADGQGDHDFAQIAGKFHTQIDAGAGDFGGLGDLGDLGDDDILGGELEGFGDIPDLAPDPLPS